MFSRGGEEREQEGFPGGSVHLSYELVPKKFHSNNKPERERNKETGRQR